MNADDQGNAATLQLTPPAGVERFVVGFSGGLDSTVLLHRLVIHHPALPLHAVHVHHGLQDLAEAWSERCAAFCAQRGIAFETIRVRIDPADPAGPEAAARAARYRALRGVIRPGDCLVTAHHRDDQAETVLMRLLRGSGIRGLAAMRPWSAFAGGGHWRPLLDLPRASLHAYALAHRLDWIEDPHNADRRYTRSWLRNDIIPRLQAHFPQAVESLVRVARLAAESDDLLEDLARIDLAGSGGGDWLDVPALLRLVPARRHNLLRCWLRQRGFLAPAAVVLDRIDAEVLAAAADAVPLLAWSGCELRRHRDRLYAMPPLLPPPPPDLQWIWAGAELLLPPGCGRLRLEAPPLSPLRVRFALGGERFRPARGRQTRTLKNVFQESGVPAWVRPRTPLVLIGDRLAYVAGIGPGQYWLDAHDGSAPTIEWLDPPVGAPAGEGLLTPL
jgi:tRNA(Ile)-lysidine synthase